MGGWACSWKDSKCSVLSKRWKITDFKDENFVPTHPFDSQQALVSLPVALGKSLRSLLLKWCCGGAECHRIWQEWPTWKELWNSHPPAPYFIRKVMEWFFEQIISTPLQGQARGSSSLFLTTLTIFVSWNYQTENSPHIGFGTDSTLIKWLPSCVGISASIHEHSFLYTERVSLGEHSKYGKRPLSICYLEALEKLWSLF